MPEWLQLSSQISPLYHYIIASHGILIKGADLKLLWDSVVKIAGFGGIIFLFGVWRFRRQSV